MTCFPAAPVCTHFKTSQKHPELSLTVKLSDPLSLSLMSHGAALLYNCDVSF